MAGSGRKKFIAQRVETELQQLYSLDLSEADEKVAKIEKELTEQFDAAFADEVISAAVEKMGKRMDEFFDKKMEELT